MTLLKVAVVLFFAMLTAASAALFVGRQQPIPPRLEMYRLGDCVLPCWIGIVPGKTTIGEGLVRIKNAYPAPDYDYEISYSPYEGTNWITLTHRDDGSYLRINFNEWTSDYVEDENTLISQIKIYSSLSLVFDDWYPVLGNPNALSVTWGNHWAQPNMLFYLQHVRLTLFNGVDNFEVDSPTIEATALDIYADIDNLYAPISIVSWQGWGVSYGDKILATMQP